MEMTVQRRARAATALLLIPLALSGCGRRQETIEHDLDLSANARGFAGGFDRGEWQWDRDRVEKRSEWRRQDGQIIVVWARPIDGSLDDFARKYDRQRLDDGLSATRRATLGGQGVLLSADDVTGEEGGALRELRFFVHDREGHDVHMLQVLCWPEDADGLAAEIGAVLASAKWVPAVAPADWPAEQGS
jgi:hypothetical protein